MRGAIKEELINRFPWLFEDLGFLIVTHDFSHRVMGSSFVVLQSDSLRVRIVNERGSVYVELAPLEEPERWMELGFLWRALTGDRPDPSLDGWVWFLRDHLAQLTEALGSNFEKTKAAFG
jgi:hypothetical protein